MGAADNGDRQRGSAWAEIGVVSLTLAALGCAAAPAVLRVGGQAEFFQDKSNLAKHYRWLEIYRHPERVGHMPTEGGHKFLLAAWVDGVVDPTVENFDRYFSPGPARDEDAHYQELRKMVVRGERIWTDLRAVTPDDTHYAARAKSSIRGMQKGDEAWAANDNESRGGPGWAFRGGQVNVLWGNGVVGTLSMEQMQRDFQWPGVAEVFPTFGPDSPYPALKKLDR